MYQKLDNNEAKIILERLAEKRENLQDSLNVEYDIFDENELLYLIDSLIQDWQSSYILFLHQEGDNVVVSRILKRDVIHSIKSNCDGEVISFVNPESGDGITMDLNTGHEKNFQLTGWGGYESVPQIIMSEIPNGALFRGN